MDPANIVVVISIFSCFANSDAMLAKLFSLAVDADGREICATDAPSEEHFASDFIQCGVLCVNMPECLQYNYIQATSSCQLFKYIPSSFASVESCRSSKRTVQHISAMNEIAEVGNSVLLKCRRTSPLIRWTFYPVGSSTSVAVVEGCRVHENFTGQYVVDSTDLNCNLYISTVKMNHSGTYACKDSLSTESPATAQLVVYQSEPDCTVNSVGTIIFSMWLVLKCVVNISDNGALFTKCLNNTGAPFGSPITLSGYRMAYEKHADTVAETYQVTCTLFVNVTSAATIQDGIPAVNTANYTYTWTPPKISVVCPPGFSAITSVNTCYGAIQEKFNYSTAKQSCQQWYPGVYPVVISSAAEQNAIQSFLGNTLTSACAYSGYGSSTWTSGQRRTLNCASSFAWKPDSVTVIDLQYNGWISGNPDCHYSIEFCVAMTGRPGFYWNDVECATLACVLCEYGPY